MSFFNRIKLESSTINALVDIQLFGNQFIPLFSSNTELKLQTLKQNEKYRIHVQNCFYI